jgi:hypothetical protein
MTRHWLVALVRLMLEMLRHWRRNTCRAVGELVAAMLMLGLVDVESLVEQFLGAFPDILVRCLNA